MPRQELAVVILAAGKGTRMLSDRAKVLHSLASRPLLIHVLDTAAILNPQRVVVVVGFQAEEVKQACADRSVEFVEQKEQLGTGHAVLQAQAVLEDYEGDVLILCGDMPLIQSSTLQALLRMHNQTEADCTLLSLKTKEKKDFGRVVRSPEGAVLRIVEVRDASEQEKTIDEYNSGVYCFNKGILFKALASVDTRNAQGEYYLTDTVGILSRNGHVVACHSTRDADELLGINSSEDLAKAEKIIQA
jgi:bifunctional UDP-N-acetylglucosamine pyrophosphorylase/glucosamine-1-phosphate N-acetyltransferase